MLTMVEDTVLTSFVLTEAQDYLVSVTYDDVTLAITGMTVEVTRADDKPVNLWGVTPMAGEINVAVRESSLSKTLLVSGATFEQVNDPQRGRRFRLPEGFVLGAGT